MTEELNMDAEHYRQAEGISASDVKWILPPKTPAHYHAYKSGLIKREESRALVIGTLCHLAVLEPDKTNKCVLFDGRSIPVSHVMDVCRRVMEWWTMRKEYYEKHKGKHLDFMLKYYEKHKEEIAEKQREYRETHKEKIAEKARKYRETHKEKFAEKARKYYEKQRIQISKNKLNLALTFLKASIPTTPILIGEPNDL